MAHGEVLEEEHEVHWGERGDADDEDAARTETLNDVRESDELEDAVEEAVSGHPQADRSRAHTQSAKLDRRRPDKRDKHASDHLEQPNQAVVRDRYYDRSCEQIAQRHRFLLILILRPVHDFTGSSLHGVELR